MHRVLDARLLFLHLGLGCRADLDDGDAADELGEPLLQLLAVVVGGRVLDLRCGAASRGPSMAVGRAGALDDGRVVLVDRDLLRLAEILQLDRLELDPEVLGDGPAVRSESATSSSIALRRSPKPGALTAATLIVPRSLLTTSVARASPSMSSAMMSSGRPGWPTSSSTGSRSFIELIFFSWIRMTGILEHDFHALRVGHEIGREVAAVELHALDDLERRVERLRLFDGDDAVLCRPSPSPRR